MAPVRRLGEGYEPHVCEDGGKLTYSVPVDSSFVSVEFSFEIRRADLSVLLTNPYRRAALEVIAHTLLQHSMQRDAEAVGQAGFDDLLIKVLHTDAAELERFIASVGREHNIAISHYVEEIMARRYATGSS